MDRFYKCIILFFISLIVLSLASCSSYKTTQDLVTEQMNLEELMETYVAETTNINRTEDKHPFYGSWHIDKVALISKMYTGTTKDGDVEENLYDPEDYLGYEIKYAADYFRLGDKIYIQPEYEIIYTTVEGIQEGGIYQPVSIYELINEEEIEINHSDEYEWLSDVSIMEFHVKFDKEITFDRYSFIPVGTQCVMLNQDTMLVGIWGKVLLASRIPEVNLNGISDNNVHQK